ncbi:hypothetical protein CIT37_32085 [Bradyrhizobium ottawaense]|uniref:pEK499-p136 HEPN domain-containing protein n=1 Tax=Bradyrhizobium ottawaense TaxID=931866 RepID=A0A2U8PET2_9BRAD|nr:hypothetical protein [Bradyrhizobium ottawaense]AWL96249.1 hypothetical protein CIT37_32085 [Bradyrhizobium ottawaense]
MTEITKDHVEWAMVGRLRLMLEEPPHQTFNVTQTYALFTSVLCWVMQRVRIKSHEVVSKDDKEASSLFKRLEGDSISADPWRLHVAPTGRIERVGALGVPVPMPRGFEAHTAARFLINLRDATAHGDARNVEPFNNGSLLVGFTFSCAEFKNRKIAWDGSITLLEADLRRIGIQLAKLYCDAIRHSEPHRRDGHFGNDAASIKEVAA